MIRLSVNVNKLATLRNARGKNLPDLLLLTEKILSFGAHGITVHPRPDGRHIRTADVWAIRELLNRRNAAAPDGRRAEFNIEGFPSADFLSLVGQVCPDQCTLVPDPPSALTSNAGWDLVAHETELNQALGRLRATGIRVSLFVDPFNFSTIQAQALIRLHPERIELYTEAYADSFGTPDCGRVTAEYTRVARVARQNQIGVNAGHDLNQENLAALVSAVPWLDEVSIGHALICEALAAGLETTVRAYVEILSRP